MTFDPPRCPNRACAAFSSPQGRLVRWGSYAAACRAERVPRYRCKECHKTFSVQTFRQDYRDRRPATNVRLFELLTSGVGLRQAARILGLACSSAQMKMRKMAAACADLHDNLSARLPEQGTYVLDEEESYEGASICTLTVPILIEKASWFIVATGVAPIRRLARRGTRRRAWQDAHEQKCGRRPDKGRECTRNTLLALARRCSGRLTLRSDQKSSYARLCREVFADRATHEVTPGSAARTTRNPLFAINTTIAMSRDNCGRLRRRSWLVSKLGRWLKGQLDIFTVYRNYVRQRFNRDDPKLAPACLLGLIDRRLHPSEALRWRQDWGAASIHPLSLSGMRSVG
jgi:transposase-like protein